MQNTVKEYTAYLYRGDTYETYFSHPSITELIHVIDKYLAVEKIMTNCKLVIMIETPRGLHDSTMKELRPGTSYIEEDLHQVALWLSQNVPQDTSENKEAIAEMPYNIVHEEMFNAWTEQDWDYLQDLLDEMKSRDKNLRKSPEDLENE